MKKLRLRKNIICLFVLVFSFSIMFFNNVFAESIDQSYQNIFDVDTKDSVYKLSEEKDIKIPFIRYATDRIIIDKELSKTGTLFSTNSIEVNSPTKGLQLLYANDSVRVNATMENAIIISGNNVVIDSNVERSAIIFARESITITENATISEDVILASRNVEVNGNIKGSLLGYTDSLSVNGTINGDLRVNANNISIKGNENILGNININTTNSDLTSIKNQYNNAVINVYNLDATNNIFSARNITTAIATCLIFSLIYILIQKLSKNKLNNTILNKTSSNSLFVILSGTIYLIVIPVVILILLLGILFGFGVIAIPLLIAYSAFTLIVCLLSTLIVGTFMFEYVKSNYIKDSNIWTDFIGSFCTFLVLYILSRITIISGYVIMALVILAIGITLTCIFKKQKN